MLECVINVSAATGLEPIVAAAGDQLRDVHADPDHNRSVLTLAGPETPLWDAVTAVARATVAHLNLRTHDGVHPRAGVLDVVPFVDLEDPWAPATPQSITWRDGFASWAAVTLDLPCFVYGPERSLPGVRRAIKDGKAPDVGPRGPHPTAGYTAVGARGVLVAFNLWLESHSVVEARRVAGAVRQPGLRTLGLQVGDRVQVSCNLTDPVQLGPADAYDIVADATPVSGAELVGLIPEAILNAVPSGRWAQLDLSPDRTIESRTRGRA